LYFGLVDLIQEAVRVAIVALATAARLAV
jgi:hypothetical protein